MATMRLLIITAQPFRGRFFMLKFLRTIKDIILYVYFWLIYKMCDKKANDTRKIKTEKTHIDINDLRKNNGKENSVKKINKRKNEGSVKRRYAGKYGKNYIFQKGIVCIALFLWTLSAVKILWNGWQLLDKEQMISAFGNNVYSNMSADISTFGKYGNINLTTGAKKIILENIAKQIGIDKYAITEKNDNGNAVVELMQSSVNGDVVCRFVTGGDMPGADSSQYIYISITLKENIDSAFTYEKIVKQIVTELDMQSEVTVNLRGEINGKLNLGMKDMVADKLLQSIGAKVVEENREEDLYTIYAYNDDIHEYIQLGSKKVNINVSIYYDETNDVTCVNLSTPINNQDY